MKRSESKIYGSSKTRNIPMTLFEKLRQASSEEEVKDGYIRAYLYPPM